MNRWSKEFSDQVSELSKSVANFDTLSEFFAALGLEGNVTNDNTPFQYH